MENIVDNFEALLSSFIRNTVLERKKKIKSEGEYGHITRLRYFSLNFAETMMMR